MSNLSCYHCVKLSSGILFHSGITKVHGVGCVESNVCEACPRGIGGVVDHIKFPSRTWAPCKKFDWFFIPGGHMFGVQKFGVLGSYPLGVGRS